VPVESLQVERLRAVNLSNGAAARVAEGMILPIVRIVKKVRSRISVSSPFADSRNVLVEQPVANLYNGCCRAPPRRQTTEEDPNRDGEHA